MNDARSVEARNKGLQKGEALGVHFYVRQVSAEITLGMRNAKHTTARYTHSIFRATRYMVVLLLVDLRFNLQTSVVY